MRTPAIVILVVSLITVSGEASEGATPGVDREVACDGSVLELAGRLFASAQPERGRRERAAFIVREATGAYAIQLWPDDPGPYQASFSGAVAAGTVAIMHTHPGGYDLPSATDQLTARRSGLPVYVLTRWKISKTNGAAAETIWSGDWTSHRARRGATSVCVTESLRVAAASSISADH